ncbi:putative pre-mRNA-splicing factor SPF27 [Paratrimastix pyriformis]|uniref:Pre-mRNA-splicing factor SPF27 n=1 Tax=Paratrimastix pyriformis TaxID=342808 RepID=A0ABQ8UFJ7_9EUKA|nr:putative pre-mRNA-splicing factor SPF27 [Paratrimastix pyriformis]
MRFSFPGPTQTTEDEPDFIGSMPDIFPEGEWVDGFRIERKCFFGDKISFAKVFSDPALRQLVNKMVEDEMKTFTPPNYLEQKQIAPVPSLESFRAEFERAQRHEPILDTKRYKMEPPPASKSQDLVAWQQAVDNAEAQLEHQNNRLLNLFLFSKYGPKKWEIYLKTLQAKHDSLTKTLGQLRDEITEINRGRNWRCSRSSLSWREFHETVKANFDIDSACLQLETQLEPLRPRLAAFEAQQKQAVEEAAKSRHEQFLRENPVPSFLQHNLEATAAAQAEASRTSPSVPAATEEAPVTDLVM